MNFVCLSAVNVVAVAGNCKQGILLLYFTMASHAQAYAFLFFEQRQGLGGHRTLERNSTELCYMFGSEPDFKRDV